MHTSLKNKIASYVQGPSPLGKQLKACIAQHAILKIAMTRLFLNYGCLENTPHNQSVQIVSTSFDNYFPPAIITVPLF